MNRSLKLMGLSGIAVGILCVVLFYYVDRSLAWAMHDFAIVPLREISQYITHLGESKFWLAVSLVGFLIAGVGYQLRRYTWQCRALLYFGATNMLALILSKGLKFLFGRYRPIELFQENLYGLHWFATQWEMHSLPSGHAVIIFSAASALSILYRRFAALFFFVALCVAATRLILEMHYLSDVVLGAYIGIVSAVLMRHILYRDRIRTC